MPEAVIILKVFLVAVLFNTSTGDIEGGITAKFPDMAACEAAKANLPPVPYGKRVYIRCVNPSDVGT